MHMGSDVPGERKARKPWRCRLGLHDFADLQRRDETMGQSAVEECLRPGCGEHRSVFRPLHGKDGPMHPRVEAALAVEREARQETERSIGSHERHVRENQPLIEKGIRSMGLPERDMWRVLLQIERDPAEILRPVSGRAEHFRTEFLASVQGMEHVRLGSPMRDLEVQLAAYLAARGIQVSVEKAGTRSMA